MVSLYMPDVVVEIAFDSGYTTPAASRTWTDVSSYVELAEGIDIDIGRQDELSVADANTLTLTLDNKDGRFTALRSASPYYPNVKVGRPIRVTVTPPGGSASTRFVGFVDEWPVEWDGTDAYAKAAIRATSRLSRLGLTAALRSIVEQEVLASGPARYWTLGDPSGATTAAESSGNDGEPLTVSEVVGAGAVAFGNAVGASTDGLTAAETFGTSAAFAQYLKAPISGVGVLKGMRTTALIKALPTATHTPIMLVRPGNGGVGPGGYAAIYIELDGTVGASASGTIMFGPNINDGLTHDIAYVWDAVTAYLIVDGVTVDTESSAGYTTLAVTEVSMSENTSIVRSHMAIWDTIVPVADVQDQGAAIVTGFAGDTTDVRLLRILDWAGVASTEVDAETGVETMTYQLTGGQSVVDALRDVESTEGGVLFDGPDGEVKFHNRSHRYLATAAATLDMASQHVGADYAPRLDRSVLVNDVTVDNPTTGESARLTDTASSDEYGIATGSATSVADSYPPLQEKASWALALYAEPRMRCPSLTVDVLAHQGLTPSAQTLLGVTVGDLLAVTNAPTQSDTTSPTYFVEGYSESIGPESYSITYNLSPTYPTSNVLILDDVDRGVLDTNLLAY